MQIKLHLDLAPYVSPADPTALRRWVKRSRIALLAAGAMAGLTAKHVLDTLLPDEPPEDEPHG